jgi:hypothetical protein
MGISPALIDEKLRAEHKTVIPNSIALKLNELCIGAPGYRSALYITATSLPQLRAGKVKASLGICFYTRR